MNGRQPQRDLDLNQMCAELRPAAFSCSIDYFLNCTRLPIFAEQAKALMQDFKDPNDPKARSTQNGSGSYLKVWLLPMLGDLPLDKINNTHLKDLVARMK